MTKLPAAPEFGSVEVTLTLQANKPGSPMGPMELLLPVDVKGGPPVLLAIRANVQLPEITLSQVGGCGGCGWLW